MKSEEKLLSINELEIGRYYHCSWNSYHNVAITYIKEPIIKKNTNFTLFYKQKLFKNNGELTSLSNKFRPATLSEIKWFDKCKKAGKFVPKNYAPKSNIPNELLDNVIYTYFNGDIVRWGAQAHLGNGCKDFFKRGSNINNIPSNYTFSTQSEREWLITCEEAGKFIKFEDRYNMKLSIKRTLLTKEDFRNTKILLNGDEEKSKKFQDLIFSLDIEWFHSRKNYTHLKATYLIINNNYNLFYGVDKTEFKTEEGNEIFYNDLFSIINPKFRIQEENNLLKRSNEVINKIELYIKPQYKVIEQAQQVKLKLKQIKLIKL